VVAYMFHGLGPLDCSRSELTCTTMNPFSHFGRTLWMQDQSTPRSLSTQNSTQKHTPMPRAGLKPMISRFEWSRSTHALDWLNYIFWKSYCLQQATEKLLLKILMEMSTTNIVIVV